MTGRAPSGSWVLGVGRVPGAGLCPEEHLPDTTLPSSMPSGHHRCQHKHLTSRVCVGETVLEGCLEESWQS